MSFKSSPWFKAWQWGRTAIVAAGGGEIQAWGDTVAVPLTGSPERECRLLAASG